MGTFPLKWEENDSVFFFLSKVDFELKHKNVRKSEGVRRERRERREKGEIGGREMPVFYWIFYFFTKEWWQTGGTIWQLVVVLQRGPGLIGSWVRVPSNERRVGASLSLSLFPPSAKEWLHKYRLKRKRFFWTATKPQPKAKGWVCRYNLGIVWYNSSAATLRLSQRLALLIQQDLKISQNAGLSISRLSSTIVVLLNNNYVLSCQVRRGDGDTL